MNDTREEANRPIVMQFETNKFEFTDDGINEIRLKCSEDVARIVHGKKFRIIFLEVSIEENHETKS